MVFLGLIGLPLARWACPRVYLGHLIFMLGLAATFASWFALTLFAVRTIWFHRRVLEDEARLRSMFGTPYLDYQQRVKRWIPGLL